MEDFEFDIEEVLEHLEGLNVIEKCQALDNLSDCLSNSLENAINEISDAQNRINDEYAASCYKRFIREIKIFINANFQEQKPDISDDSSCTIIYNGVLMVVCPCCSCGEWSIVVYKSINGGSNKLARELIGKLGGNAETETLSVSEEEVVPKMKLALSFSDHYQVSEPVSESK